MSAVGCLQRLRGQAAPDLGDEPAAHVLRAHAANVAEVKLTEELLAEAGLGEAVARRLLGDLAYRARRWRRPWLTAASCW